ncbi:hypothetical protein [Paraburkholderia nodosa]|nr:hypothetical protein [Paraburkholderia nodosa]
MDAVIANVRAIHPTPASLGMLIDSSGHVIAHPDDTQIRVGYCTGSYR